MPDFWYNDTSLRSRLLSPAALLYQCIAREQFRRRTHRSVKLDVPVICVGNLTVGGTGKTPVVRALRASLKDWGDVHVLTRGYGGRSNFVGRVDPEMHTARDVGDEALLHAMDGPVWKGADRRITGRLAQDAGASLILMDDGLQNPLLFRDLNLCVISREVGFGNGMTLPAGPLRELPGSAFQRIDAVIATGDQQHKLPETHERPVFSSSFEIAQLDLPAQRPIWTLAGIAHPERFIASLATQNMRPTRTCFYPDHHDFSSDELETLFEEASRADAVVLTTEKDFVRLPAAFRTLVHCVHGQMTFVEPAELHGWINERLRTICI